MISIKWAKKLLWKENKKKYIKVKEVDKDSIIIIKMDLIKIIILKMLAMEIKILAMEIKMLVMEIKMLVLIKKKIMVNLENQENDINYFDHILNIFLINLNLL